MAFEIPSWISGITPNLFSQALQAGARVGLELTDQSIRAQALAQAQMDRQAAAQERAERAAERQREFEETRLLNVQKIAQDAAQLQQLQKHQTAQEANQALQESRLLNFQTGQLGVDRDRLALDKLKLLQGASPLAGERYLKMSDDEATLAEQSRLAGDAEGYQQHLERSRLWRGAIPSHQSSLTVSTDESGRPVVTQTTGAQAASINPLGKPTTALTTKAQENTVKYENALTLINRLEKSLTPRDVGARGLGGEMILDRTLAQFYPSFADKDRIKQRTALGAVRESLLRTVSDDPRFSNVDRDEISKLLPSTGIFESYPDAMGRLKGVRQILTDRVKRYSSASGVPAPASTQSREDIIGQYNTTVQQLTDAVKSNRMTPKQAFDQAQKLHKGMQDALEQFH